jgi:hypothetical protein
MKCCKCLQEKEKCFFTTNQLKKKLGFRTCKNCGEPQQQPENTIANFLTWLQTYHVDIAHICIEFVTNEFRLVRSTSFLKKNTKVIKIPKCLLMTTVAAKELEVCKNLPPRQYHSHTWLALMLLTERDKGKDSFWYPYLQLLPRTFDNVPLFFSQAQKETLGQSFARDMIDHTIKQLEMDFYYIQGWTLADYMWARVMVITRIFGISVDGEMTEAFVPLADMCNHTPRPNTSWGFDSTEDAFVMSCSRHISNQVEVTDSYGAKCNSRYFVNYGFTLKQNELNNQAVLFFASNQQSGGNFDDGFSHYNLAIKHKWESKVSQDNMVRFQFNLVKGTKSHEVTLSMFHFLRLQNATPEESSTWKVEEKETILSKDNERLVIEHLFKSLEQRLQEIPSGCPEHADIDQVLKSEQTVLLHFQETLHLYQRRIRFTENILPIFKQTFMYV